MNLRSGRLDARLHEDIEELREDIGALRPTLELLVSVLHRAEQRLDKLETTTVELSEQLRTLAVRQEELAGLVERDMWPVLKAAAAEEASNRRRLHALRSGASYGDAWTAPDPLVTVTIVTRGQRLQLLLERALASVLAQTHRRLEVIVIADRCGPEVRAAVEGIGDARVRCAEVDYAVTHSDSRRQWRAAAAMGRNEGYRLAGGAWTLDFDDDDSLRGDAIECLLAHARATRAEVAYGDFEQRLPDGSAERLGSDPPELGRSSLAASLVHAGLLFFHRQHFAADFGVPGDWFRIESMLRTGVRFSRLDALVLDYYPSHLWEGPPGD